ncbi:MAG: flagellar export protein FliJ [Bacteroidetes bacterium]|jgi:flagellar export protein FliJ|nr:flagellar export protein FliJ [Bacteroidota bacterium]
MKVGDSRFGTLLRVKSIQERKSQQELVEIQNKKDEERQTLSQLQERREGEIAEAVRKSRMRATDLQSSRAFLTRLSKEIGEQENKIEEIQVKEDEKREELVERSRSKHMVEDLEEKYQTQVLREAERKEQRLIDVLAQRVKLEV